MANTGNTIVSIDHKDKEVAVPMVTDNNETKIALPAASIMPSLNQESHTHKHVPSSLVAFPAAPTVLSLNDESHMPKYVLSLVAVPVAANSKEIKIALPAPPTMHSSNPESQILQHVPSLVAVPVAANANETKVAHPAPSTIPFWNPESQVAENVPSLQTTVTVLPNLNLFPSSEQSTADGSGSKRSRMKNVEG